MPFVSSESELAIHPSFLLVGSNAFPALPYNFTNMPRKFDAGFASCVARGVDCLRWLEGCMVMSELKLDVSKVSCIDKPLLILILKRCMNTG